MNRAEQWRDQGRYFSWQPRAGDAAEVEVFHVELGDPDAPPLVLVHGFPTSSVDWIEVATLLSDRYRVCAMDFPGFGFSDKPLGWGYSLVRDVEVLEHYVAEVLGLESMTMLAHDRGSSVAMIHTTGESAVRLEHLFITNGNVFLPLSNLNPAQRLMLDPATGPAMLAQAAPEQLAAGMGLATYTPPRGPDDPEVEALTTIFSHGTGLPVLHETIQYLVERAEHEDAWLRTLAAMDVPTTFIWGLNDTVVAAAGDQLRLERVHDAQARAELALLRPGREPLPAERPARRGRGRVPPRAGGTGRRPAGRRSPPNRAHRSWSTARAPNCPAPPTSCTTRPERSRRPTGRTQVRSALDREGTRSAASGSGPGSRPRPAAAVAARSNMTTGSVSTERSSLQYLLS